MTKIRYIAIGDSFTEGYGDELPDGTPRGWADLTAIGWAASRGEAVQYANLSVRGKLAWGVVDEQLEQALAMKPTHLSYNAGGNDMLRPSGDPDHVADSYSRVIRRCLEEGVVPIAVTSANPADMLPLSPVLRRRGNRFTSQIVQRMLEHPDAVHVMNWTDHSLSERHFWAQDRLHLNARGQHRAAARVLDALGETVPDGWWSLPGDEDPIKYMVGPRYYVAHVGPWLKRRLTGRSSGDGRSAKFSDWIDVDPDGGVLPYAEGGPEPW